ncbi:MAG: LuxR C-terminal-related transcriptional regulator [Tepidiformaceae bacterium]
MLDETPHLTKRQREVLALIADGHTNPEIAAALSISLDGAKWHVREILSALGVDSREAAAAYWRTHNGNRHRLVGAMRPLFLGAGLGRGVVLGIIGTGCVAASLAVVVSLGLLPNRSVWPTSAAGTELTTRPTPTAGSGQPLGTSRVVSTDGAGGLTVAMDGGKSVRLRISPSADIVWPTGHVPTVGDSVEAVGTWTSTSGPTFTATKIWFNVVRLKGVVSAAMAVLPGGAVWQVAVSGSAPITVNVSASKLEHATLGNLPSSPGPLLSLPVGAGVDIIGFRSEGGEITATSIDAWPPS